MRSLLLEARRVGRGRRAAAAERLSDARRATPSSRDRGCAFPLSRRRRARRTAAGRCASSSDRASRNGIATIEPPKVGAAVSRAAAAGRRRRQRDRGPALAGARRAARDLHGLAALQAGARPRRRARQLAGLVRAVPARRGGTRAHRRSAPLDPGALSGSRALSRARRANGEAVDRGRLSAREDLPHIVAQAGERWRVLVEQRAQR